MIGFKLVTFTGGSKLEKRGRAQGNSVIGKAEGDNSREFDTEFFQSHGMVSRPSKKTRGIVLQLGNLLFSVASYTYGIEPPENEGATKLYSTDLEGAEKATLVLDSDGKTSLSNATDDLAKCIDDLITELKGITTYGSPTNHALSAANIANLTTIATRFKTIIKEA